MTTGEPVGESESSFLAEYSAYLFSFFVLVILMVAGLVVYKRRSASPPPVKPAVVSPQTPQTTAPAASETETRRRSSSVGNKNPDQNKWLKQKIVLEQLKKHCAKENIPLGEDTEENLLQKHEKLIETVCASWDYPFDVSDSEWNILYTLDEHDNRIIRGATLIKIVEKLTDDISTLSIQYVAPFLLTYRSFCSPVQLWDLLYKRYRIPFVEGLTQQEIEKLEVYRKHVRTRVWYIHRFWIENHFYDFEDKLLIDKLKEFIETVLMQDMPQLALQLQRVLLKQLQHEEAKRRPLLNLQQEAPKPIIPEFEPRSVLDLPPLEVARQLTLTEYDFYTRIQPKECLNECWNKKPPEGAPPEAPNVIALIQRFNNLSRWVVTEIVKEKDMSRRARLIIHFKDIAAESKKLHNFHAMMGIVSGLMSSAIGRLKKTWAILPPDVSQGFEKEYSTLFFRNFRELREAVKQSEPPCLPYLGIYLGDLTAIENGNLDTVNDTLLNFEKRLMISKVISELRQNQQKPYNLLPVPVISSFLNKTLEGPFLDEKDSHKLSQSLE